MAEYYVDPENGSNANPGTEAEPWLLIPGQTGANTVTAGDIINVKNGTTTTARIIPPVNNLTYRGYGLADNVLYVTVPQGDPRLSATVRVVREEGVHEGMWTLDATAIDADGGINSSTRTGLVFEDLDLRGSQIGTRHALTLASSSANVSGFTIRRFQIIGAAAKGINANTKDVLIEWGRISHTQDDNIGLAATTANGFRVGSHDVLRNLELREPNRITEGAGDTGTGGDHLQLLPASGQWGGSLTAENIYCDKTTVEKQAVVAHGTDAGSVLTFRNWRVGGGGDCQFLIGHIKGTVLIDGVFADEWSVEDIFMVRFDPADVSPPSYGWDTGSSVTIKRVFAKGSRCPGLLSTVVSSAAYSFDGSVVVENCTALGVNDNALSYASSVALWSGTSQSTYGTNFQLRVRNNYLGATGKPHFILPTGSAGDAKFSILGNCVTAGGAAIGSTSYASLAAFQAAHSQARGNLDSDPKVSADGTPLPGSRLLRGGVDVGDIIAINGVRGRGLIGALGRKSVSVGNPGNFVQARLAIVREQQIKLLQEQLEEDSDDMDS